MQMKVTGYLAIAAIFVVCLLGAAQTARTANATADAAIRAAARHNRYVFITFYKQNDGASARMLAAVSTMQGKLAGRADFVNVDVNDPANRQVVTRFSADRSPIPLTIVVAPNGAVTAGFPREINANANFSNVFVSQGQAAVLKVMQERRLAVVCLQNANTRYNRECMATANALKKDQRIGSAVTIVKIDPADQAEAKFLRQCNIKLNSPNAQLVVFAPPGRVIGTFDGGAPQNTVIATLLQSLRGGCCSGGQCGPGGCGK